MPRHEPEPWSAHRGSVREVTPETAEAIYDYVSPVPLFASGAEAAAHGRSGIDDPDIDAVLAIRKIERRRTDLTEPKGN